MSSRTPSPARSPRGRPNAGRIASHLAVMGAVAVVMGVLIACLAIPFAGLVGVAAKDVSKGMVNLPESLEAKDLSQTTRIYDVNGNLIASLYDQNRINVPLTSISRPMVKAIVAIEDYRFYDHGALDLKGTLRAFVTNQANGGSVQGGSSITQQMVKQTLLYQAEDQGGARGGDRGDLRPQDPRAALRHRLREEPHQGLDPRALPQHRLLRRRCLRRAVGRAALLLQERPRAQPPRVGDARRSGEEPGRLRPGRQPRARGEPSQRRPRPARPARRAHREEGGAAQGHADQEDAQCHQRRQRLPAVTGTVLLRLRRQLAAQGPGAGRHDEGASHEPEERRPQDPDHHRPRHAEGRRPVGVRPRLPDRPGHRRPGDGRARHRRRTRAGAVAPDGPGQGRRRDRAQLHGPQEVRRRQRLPGRVDLQGLRPGVRHQPGHPAQHDHQLAAGAAPRRRRSSRTATAPTPATAWAGTSRTPPARAPSTSTPAPRSR